MLANDISVQVTTRHLTEHPVNEEGKFAFAYFITISNHSEQPVQLISRYWLITDGNGKQTEVSGAGVVGQQPVIKPGESYEYNSGAILDTPVGTMQGYYEMQDSQQQLFEVPIDIFTLAVPSQMN